MARILLVDDEPSILSVLSTLLKSEGHEVHPARGGKTAKEMLAEQEFDLMITDIRMDEVDGMQLLRYTNEHNLAMSVILLTAYGSVETAVQAMKDGAFDYVTKPFKVDELLITVQRALEYANVKAENVDLKARLEGKYHFDNIVGESASMRKVCEMIQRVAPADTTVLILGESGTGKELVAKAIHSNSDRKNEEFVPINCAAMPEALLESELFGHVKGAFTGASSDKQGLFEAADGGTLFLDEISSMPLSLQSKLLRVLQEREIRKVGGTENISVDVRVLAATNEDLESLIEQDKFREDLYYRISVIPIRIPPLRERTEDILPLAYHFIREQSGEHQENAYEMDKEVQLTFQNYSWPGNVRELENAMRHAMAFAEEGVITKDALPAKISEQAPAGDESGVSGQTAHTLVSELEQYRGKSLKAFLREKEKEYLRQVLESTGGDKEEAAKKLNISMATLYRKLPEHDS